MLNNKSKIIVLNKRILNFNKLRESNSNCNKGQMNLAETMRIQRINLSKAYPKSKYYKSSLKMRGC